MTFRKFCVIVVMLIGLGFASRTKASVPVGSGGPCPEGATYECVETPDGTVLYKAGD